MLRITRFVLGLRPPYKMFRAQTSWGDVVDALIASNPTLFATIHQSREAIKVVSKDKVYSFTLNPQQASFEKNTKNGTAVDVDATLSDFLSTWNIVNGILRVKDMRRIGIFGQATVYPDQRVSALLLAKLTHLAVPNFPAKFALQFEKREPTIETMAPDLEKDDFVNTIYTLQEAAEQREDDDEDADEDAVTPPGSAMKVGVDYQKYYAPSLSHRDIQKDSRIHARVFKERVRAFNDELEVLGALGE